MPRPNGMICVRLPRDRRWIVSISGRMSDTTLNSASTACLSGMAESGITPERDGRTGEHDRGHRSRPLDQTPARHLLPWSLAAGLAAVTGLLGPSRAGASRIGGTPTRWRL